MNRNMIVYALLVTLATGLGAQTTDQISTGNGYTKFAYYKLSDGSSQQVNNDAWDLAFSNLNVQTAGIFINESTSSSQGQTVPGMEAYDPFVFDFSEVILPGNIEPESQIFNPETSWAEGAFNTTADTTNSNDYGWGAWESSVSKVVGYKVFVLKLRNGEYRKVIFDEYDGASYKFRVAQLDGSGETSHTVNTAFGNGSPVVYYSLGPNGSNVVTPTGWDLVFCRYIDILDAGGVSTPYPVTGILSGDGVEVARADGVDPATVDHNIYLDSFSNRLDVINHDWKFFNLNTGWVVEDDRAYFVKVANGDLYKLVFTAFGGASNGTATVQRTYIGNLTSAPDLPRGLGEVLVYPNPVADRITLSFTADAPASLRLRLLDITGRIVWASAASAQSGLNVLEINPLPALQAGVYVLSVQLDSGQFSRLVSVAR